MADLRIPPEALLQALFPDRDFLTLRGIRFDATRQIVILDLAGPDVPEGGEIVAIITMQNRVTRFALATPN